jgi:hypothetical protein
VQEELQEQTWEEMETTVKTRLLVHSWQLGEEEAGLERMHRGYLLRMERLEGRVEVEGTGIRVRYR